LHKNIRIGNENIQRQNKREKEQYREYVKRRAVVNHPPGLSYHNQSCKVVKFTGEKDYQFKTCMNTLKIK